MCSRRIPSDDLKGEDFLGAEIWREDGVVHIDVSNLPPPDPFVAVMRLIAEPEIGNEIVFHNDQEPVHLFPELMDLGWGYRVESDRPGEFCMRIIRESGA